MGRWPYEVYLHHVLKQCEHPAHWFLCIVQSLRQRDKGWRVPMARSWIEQSKIRYRIIVSVLSGERRKKMECSGERWRSGMEWREVEGLGWSGRWRAWDGVARGRGSRRAGGETRGGERYEMLCISPFLESFVRHRYCGQFFSQCDAYCVCAFVIHWNGYQK